jgi:glycine cleavage system transcriptional repressor
MTQFTVSVVGEDRPGIVAAVTGALLDAGANAEDCRAAILAGSFAIVLSVEVPSGTSRDDLARALQPVTTEFGLSADVRPASAGHRSGGDRCVVTIYGADRPGIVHGAAQALAGAGANIADLSSRLVGDPAIYVLGIEVDLPAGMSPAALEGALRCPALAGLDISVQSESERLL